MQTNYMNSPKTSDCDSHLHNFTLLGCPGNESVCGSHLHNFTLLGCPGNESVCGSHFHRTLCFSLDNTARNAFLVAFLKLELRKLDHMLK